MEQFSFRLDVPKDQKATVIKKKLKNVFNDIKFLIRKRDGMEFILWEQNTNDVSSVKNTILSTIKENYTITNYNKINHDIDKKNYPVLSRKIPLRDAIAIPFFNFNKSYTLFFPKEKGNNIEKSMTYKFMGNKILFDDKSRFFYNKNNELLCLEDMLVSFEEIYKKRSLEYPEYIPYRKVTLTNIECTAYISAFERIKELVEKFNEGEKKDNGKWYARDYADIDYLAFLKVIKSDREFPKEGNKERECFGLTSDGLTEDCFSFVALKSIYNLVYWQIIGVVFFKLKQMNY